MRTTMIAAIALAIVPTVALAQRRDTTAAARDTTARAGDPARAAAGADTTRDRATTAAARTEAAGVATESETTPAMRAAQNNARVVGTPAWWRLHSTADGKPIQGQAETGRRTNPTGAARPPRR